MENKPKVCIDCKTKHEVLYSVYDPKDSFCVAQKMGKCVCKTCLKKYIANPVM
jgi:hypothetical protein